MFLNSFAGAGEEFFHVWDPQLFHANIRVPHCTWFCERFDHALDIQVLEG
jgi:hypothetical protein